MRRCNANHLLNKSLADHFEEQGDKLVLRTILKNGAGLDADSLPAKLDKAEIRLAMRILKMLSQNEIERE